MYHCLVVILLDIWSQISTTCQASPILACGLEVPLLLIFSAKSYVNDLYDNGYTGEQAENNEEESGDKEDIDIKLTGEENTTNENNENVVVID